MIQSLDSYVSGRLGIDNHLCPPLRSASWWALVVTDIVIVAESWRRFAARGPGVFILAALATTLLGLYFAFRVQLHKLTTVLQGEQITILRTVSATALSIIGTALAACFFGIAYMV